MDCSRRYMLVLFTLSVWICLNGGPGSKFTHALDKEFSYDEFVQEVIDEDAWQNEDPFYSDDEEDSTKAGKPYANSSDDYEERLRRKREEQRLKQQAEADRAKRQAAEEAFARELRTLSPEQQKLLRQKRQKDSKIVQRILSAWQRRDYYAVIGIRWLFPEGFRLIKGRGIGNKSGSSPQKFNKKDFFLKGRWPDWTIFRVSTRAIQQRYRKQAVRVHPDKNRDPRTDQAFVAVQDAYAILSDPMLRREYEEECRQHRIVVRQAWKDRYHKVIDKTIRPLWTITTRALGPLTIPLLVIVALVL